MAFFVPFVLARCYPLAIGLLLAAGAAHAQCSPVGGPATNLQATAITATTATFTFSSGVVVCAAPRISYTYAGGSPVSVPYAMPLLLTGLPPATAITVTVVRRVPASLNQGAPCCESPAATLTFTTAAPLAVAAVAGATTLALAPNPAQGRATLTLAAPLPAPALVQVFDGLGRAVRQLPLPARATTAVLEMAGLAPGLYLVRCGAATARLVVE